MNESMASVLICGVYFCATILIWIGVSLSKINARQQYDREIERRNLMRHLGADYSRK